MKFTQVRSATIILEYAGKKILIDPMLGNKGAYPAFADTVNGHLFNPLVDLPISITDILNNVDAIIVTHTHLDHWDEAAKKLIPKDMLIFTQNEQDASEIQAAGFTNTRVLTENTEFDGGITLIRTPGQHGSDDTMEKIGYKLGEVCGIVFKHASEKTVYVAGDTVWNKYVEENLIKYSPDIAILNAGDAQIIGGAGSIIMNKEDVVKVCQEAPQTTIIAVHLEALNHCLLSRKELREFVNEKGFKERVLIPEDGESYTL